MRIMKKAALSVFAIFATVSALAQYQVGDLYEKDGIPCVVIRVDDSGEHGTVMSLTGSLYLSKALSETNLVGLDAKAQKKAVSKAGSAANKLYKAYVKSAVSVITDVAPLLGKSGKENAEIIRKYCQEKNVDLAKFFPEQAWAQSLGEGWYIAGDTELEDYSYTIGEGLGKSLYPKGNGFEVNKINKAFYAKQKALAELCKTTDGFQTAVVPNVVMSSSFTPHDKDPKRHILSIDSISIGNIEYRLFRAIKDYSFTGGVLFLFNISNCACNEF